MEEVVAVLNQILSELKEVNNKLDAIQGYGLNNNSIEDICHILSNIQGRQSKVSLDDILLAIQTIND